MLPDKARAEQVHELGFSSQMCALRMVQQAPSSASEEFTVVGVNLVLDKVLLAAKYPGLFLRNLSEKFCDGVNPHPKNSCYFTLLFLLPPQVLGSGYRNRDFWGFFTGAERRVE